MPRDSIPAAPARAIIPFIFVYKSVTIDLFCEGLGLVSVSPAPPYFGDVAQLARAPALQAGGRGFESLHLHHVEMAVQLLKYHYHNISVIFPPFSLID